jgi:hypothetical protein
MSVEVCSPLSRQDTELTTVLRGGSVQRPDGWAREAPAALRRAAESALVEVDEPEEDDDQGGESGDGDPPHGLSVRTGRGLLELGCQAPAWQLVKEH